MKATIQQIVERISALSEPREPALVQKIFIDYPEFTSSTLPKDLEFAWTQLDLIFKLAQQGVDLNEAIKDLKAHEADIVLYTEKGIVAQSELTALELELQKLQQAIIQSRQELTELYTNLLQTLNMPANTEGQASSTPEGLTKKQLRQILDIRNDIQREIKLLTLPTAKLKLIDLNQKQSEQLHTLNNYLERYNLERTLPGVDNLEAWNYLQFSLGEKIKKINELKPKLALLQEKFADCLSTADSQRKISVLQIKNGQLSRELETLGKQIQQHELPPKVQAELIEEFQQTTDSRALLASYQGRLDTVLSYVNVNSWTNWLINKERYNAEQAEHSRRHDFLSLLFRQKEKQGQQAEVRKQIEILTPITNASVMSATTEERLVSLTRNLLNELPGCHVPEDFSASADVTDFYLLVINNLFLIPEHLRQYELYLSFVNNLVPIIGELLKYRKEYNLPPAQDALLPSKDELQRVIPDENSLNHKNEQLRVCEIYIGKAKLLVANLKVQTEKIQAINAMKKDIAFNIDQLRIALEFKTKLQQRKSFGQQIEEHNEQLKLYQQDIAQVLQKVKDAEAQKTPTVEQDSSVRLDKPPQVLIDEQALPHPDEAPPLIALELAQEADSHQHKPTPPVTTSEIHVSVAPVIKPVEVLELVIENYHKAPVNELGHDSDPIVIEPPQEASSIIIKQSQEPPAQEKPKLVLIEPVQSLSPPPAEPITVATEQPQLKQSSPSKAPSPEVKPLEQKPPVEVQSKTHSSKVDQVILRTKPDESAAAKLNPPPSPSPEEQQLHEWHQANLAALAKQPEALQSWYLALYEQASQAIKNNPSAYEYSYLISDIFFELHNKTEVHVLEAYKTLCPQPQEDCSALLALKPKQKISAQFMTELELEQEHLPLPLKKLNQHYKHLKPKHPLAAELLAQALHNLYSLWKGEHSNAAFLQQHSIIEDPRYDLLKRQRGFLKIWQAIEDFFNWLEGKLSGQAKHEYWQKPSFFKTHSEDLVLEAELFISQEKSYC